MLQTEKKNIREIFKQKHLSIYLGIIPLLCSVQINKTRIPLLGKQPNLGLLATVMIIAVLKINDSAVLKHRDETMVF